jgi:hypothetical protein
MIELGLWFWNVYSESMMIDKELSYTTQTEKKRLTLT